MTGWWLRMSDPTDVNPSHVLDKLEKALAKPGTFTLGGENPTRDDMRKLLAVARAAVAYREACEGMSAVYKRTDFDKWETAEAELLRTTAALGDGTGE